MLVARINDTGIAYCPSCETTVSGRIITGNTTVLVNGQPISYMNCTFQGSCGHTASIIATSKNLTNGQPISCMNDRVEGSINGSIITGSSNVMTN